MENQSENVINQENALSNENLDKLKIAKAVPLNTEETSPLEAYRGQYKIAMQYANSDLVPQIFRGKPGNVLIAMGLSEKTGIDLFTIMQNLNIIKGRVGWSGSFCKTLIERTGKFTDIEYVYVGEKGKDNFGCYLQAIQKSNGKIIKGTTVDMVMVKAENWDINSKWKTMSEQMLGYRAASFFARLHCPEALSGIYTSEENEDVISKVTEIEDVL